MPSIELVNLFLFFILDLQPSSDLAKIILGLLLNLQLVLLAFYFSCKSFASLGFDLANLCSSLLIKADIYLAIGEFGITQFFK